MAERATASLLPDWAQVKPARLAHIERVVGLATRWANEMKVSSRERDRWLRAAWLHDALRDASPEELTRLAPDSPAPVSLRHGPAAAAKAASLGETDRGVLDAVHYHSVGFADWDMVGRVLYCADYLEPGRRFEAHERAELASRFASDPTAVLREVARRRLEHGIRTGWMIPEPTQRFWNALVGDGPHAWR